MEWLNSLTGTAPASTGGAPASADPEESVPDPEESVPASVPASDPTGVLTKHVPSNEQQPTESHTEKRAPRETLHKAAATTRTGRGTRRPNYMQAKKSPSARWRPLLDDDELKAAVNSGLSAQQWRDLAKEAEQKPERERVRREQKKAAAEALVDPKPTHIPKPANWRKKTYAAEKEGASEWHDTWENVVPLSQAEIALKQQAEEARKAKFKVYGSQRPMSTKGREFQQERQREMQERRRVNELRSQRKEDLATENHKQRLTEIAYFRRKETGSTATGRAWAAEKAKKAKAEAESAKCMSKDSRHLMAQQAAEARAAAEAAAAKAAEEEAEAAVEAAAEVAAATGGAVVAEAPDWDEPTLAGAVVEHVGIGRPEVVEQAV